MSRPATNLDASVPTARTPRRGFQPAVEWALAGALCAGGVWFCAAFVSLLLLGVYRVRFEPNYSLLALASLAMAVCGAFSGLLATIAIDLRLSRAPRVSARTLAAIVLFAGVTSGLTIPAIFVSEKLFHPLVGSTLLWAIAGALAGLCGYAQCEQRVSPIHLSFSFHGALVWALAGAGCSGIVWASSLVGSQWLLGADFFPDDLPNAAVGLAVIRGAIGGGYGLIVGGITGLIRVRNNRVASALALGVGYGFFGALGTSVSLLAVAAIGEQLYRVLSSSLVWSAVGFAMGLYGYFWSRVTSEHVEPSEEDEDETQPEGKTIQWLLRERKRRWDAPALIHVLPVLIASVGSLVVAALYAPSELSIAFLAVGVLGLSIALVLHNQDTRLRAIEQRFRKYEQS